MKNFIKSWTLWANFLILTLSIFDSDFFELFELSEKTIAIILGVIVKGVAILNIALRLKTKGEITFKPQDEG